MYNRGYEALKGISLYVQGLNLEKLLKKIQHVSMMSYIRAKFRSD